MTETRNLGPEYDAKLISALSSVLKELGAIPRGGSWGGGGSQELSSADFDVAGEPLHVEAETYIGLCISGASHLVAEIERLVSLRHKPLEARAALRATLQPG